MTQLSDERLDHWTISGESNEACEWVYQRKDKECAWSDQSEGKELSGERFFIFFPARGSSAAASGRYSPDRFSAE
jgi:hypothetical protein